jgi:hypothetical protein
MNAEILRPYLEAGYNSNELSRVGFSIAGGLNANIVRQELPAIVKDYPDISWDAEAQLHPVQYDGTRPIDRGRTADYLEASAEVLSMYN